MKTLLASAATVAALLSSPALLACDAKSECQKVEDDANAKCELVREGNATLLPQYTEDNAPISAMPGGGFNATTKDDIEGNSTRASRGLPVKEITYIKIANASSLLPQLPDSHLYVAFYHRGKYRGKSMPLKELSGASYVDLPILATEEALTEPIRCEIKQDHRFFPDETLFASDIDLRDGNEIIGVVRDPQGNDTGARIELSLFTTEWLAGASFDGPSPRRTSIDASAMNIHTLGYHASKLLIGDTEQVSERTNVDQFYLFAMSTLDHMANRFFIGGAEVLSKPKEMPNPDLPTVAVLDGLIEYPTRDESIDPYWEISYVVPLANLFYPMTDRNTLVTDRASMRNEIRTENIRGNMIEPSEGRWVAPLSDASMARMFFASMGMFGIRRVRADDKFAHGNHFVADNHYLGELQYKDAFENLGCKAYFDDAPSITLIEDFDSSVYRPGDEHWEWAKLKVRSASFTLISLQHIVHYHLKLANVPSMALRKYLDPSHPIRMAFTPHFFRTAQTCLQAKDMLVAKRGAL